MSTVWDSGFLSATPPGGSTPVIFGGLQGVESDVDFNLNPVKTGLQAPVGYAVAGLNLIFKARLAQLNSFVVNSLFFGMTASSGSKAVAQGVQGAVPINPGPYTVTPVVPQSGVWVQDLGVQYQASGIQLLPVTGVPGPGQYRVSAGIYTFNSADMGTGMSFNLLYNRSIGSSLALPNNWQGMAPSFSVVLNNSFGGAQITWQLNRCVSASLKLLTAVNKISIPDFEFRALGDASSPTGFVGTYSFSD